jgi:PAS domain S-box-containing protein
MLDQDKTREQLIDELTALRRRISELESIVGNPASSVETGDEKDTKFRLFMDNSPVVAWLKDETGRHVYINRTLEKFFGVSLNDWLGKTDHEIWNQEVAQRFRENDLAVLASGQPQEFTEYTLDPLGNKCVWLSFKFPFRDSSGATELNAEWRTFKNGEDERWLMSRGRPIYDQDGRAVSYIGVVIDVTDRKLDQKNLESGIRRLWTILSSLYGGVLLVSNEGIVEFANQVFCDASRMEYTAKELVGKKASDILVKIAAAHDDPAAAVARIKAIIARNEPVKSEEITMSDGKIFLRDFIPIVIDDKPYGRFWHIVDISEIKATELALRESENKFLSAFMNSPVAMSISSALDGKYVDVNDIFVKESGYGREEIIGHTSEELELFTNLEDRQHLIDKVSKGGSVYGLEADLRIKSGEIITCSISCNLIKTGGKPYFLSSILNITDATRMMETLSESEERFRLVVGASPDAICITRLRDGLLLEINDAFTKVSGYTRDDVRHKTSVEINIWRNNSERDKVLDLIIKNGVCVNEEAFFRRKDGSLFCGLVSASILSHKGEQHVIYIIRDITDRLQAEHEQQELRERLFQAQKMESLGTLVGGIAHDFNNMLQIIMGYAEILLDDPDRGKKSYFGLRKILETSQEGAELVDKLLAFGQQAQIVPTLLDLNHQLRMLSTLLKRTLPQYVDIRIDVMDIAATIKADPNQIDQLIMNLAINASEAMPHGGQLGISVGRITLDDQLCAGLYGAKPGNYVSLSVSDTGSGIDTEILPRIFDPFFTTKERGTAKGTGLGLSVVKGIAQQLGGFVSCESQLGKGAEFRVFFPAAEPVLTPERTTGEIAESQKAQTILVVEDNTLVAELEQNILESSGYQVILASNGKEAINIFRLRRNEISLVLLDLIMPEMSGRDCLMELLRIDPLVKTLVVSGYSPEDELSREIGPYIKGFLRKPCRMPELLEAVRRALEKHRR